MGTAWGRRRPPRASRQRLSSCRCARWVASASRASSWPSRSAARSGRPPARLAVCGERVSAGGQPATAILPRTAARGSSRRLHPEHGQPDVSHVPGHQQGCHGPRVLPLRSPGARGFQAIGAGAGAPGQATQRTSGDRAGERAPSAPSAAARRRTASARRSGGWVNGRRSRRSKPPSTPNRGPGATRTPWATHAPPRPSRRALGHSTQSAMPTGRPAHAPVRTLPRQRAQRGRLGGRAATRGGRQQGIKAPQHLDGHQLIEDRAADVLTGAGERQAADRAAARRAASRCAGRPTPAWTAIRRRARRRPGPRRRARAAGR